MGERFFMLGEILGFIGGERANASRERIAQQANEFSAQQYATRYQTTVKDLTAAGLNPMLAYSQGPGNAPSGQQAQGIENTMASAVEAGQKSANKELMKQQLLQSKEQVNNIQADTILKQANAAVAESQAKLNSAQTAKAEEDERVARGNANLAAVDLVRRGQTQATGINTQEHLAKLYFSQVAVNKGTLPRLASEVVLNTSNASLARARIAEAVANGQIAQHDVNAAYNRAEYEKSQMGRTRRFRDDVLDTGGKVKDLVTNPNPARTVIHKKGK